jgi:hypothetical protein
MSFALHCTAMCGLCRYQLFVTSVVPKHKSRSTSRNLKPQFSKCPELAVKIYQPKTHNFLMIFSVAQKPHSGRRSPQFLYFYISLRHSTLGRPVSDKTNNTHKKRHPYTRKDSNPQSQQVGGSKLRSSLLKYVIDFLMIHKISMKSCLIKSIFI